MDSLNINNLHHAYILEGGMEEWEVLCNKLSDAGVRVAGNPDISFTQKGVFTIDDARLLHERQLQKPLTASPKIFYIHAERLTHEAQNALLKTFEEPTKNTHIILAVPSVRIILPTLLSRAEVISASTTRSAGGKDAAGAFLSGTINNRLEMIGRVLEDDEKGDILSFLNALEMELYEHLNEGDVSQRSALREVYAVREYASDRSALRKQLLEHLAHTLPRITRNQTYT